MFRTEKCSIDEIVSELESKMQRALTHDKKEYRLT